jgi:hypothetical protein
MVDDLLLTPTSYNSRFPWERKLNSMAIINTKSNLMYGWVYNEERNFKWQNRSKNLLEPKVMRNATLLLPPDFKPGNYVVEFFDTLTGKVFFKEFMNLKDSLTLPDFEDDIAFILRRQK